VTRLLVKLILLAIAGAAALAFAGCHDANRSPVTPNPRAHATTSPFNASHPGDARRISGIPFRWCPPGHFTMGSPRTEPDRRPGEDQVEVTLTRGFWIGQFELTQAQWKRAMGKLPGPATAELPEGDNLPVGNVNFVQAEAFCGALTKSAHASGELPREWEIRLPTEAQWEYACRAGTTTATAFGDSLNHRQANFAGTPYNTTDPTPNPGRASEVGKFPPNAWGLYDMHGNTYEWCRDWSHDKLPGGIDPDLHDVPARSRIRRGGGWGDPGWSCRSAFRLRFEPERGWDHIGFRIVVVRGAEAPSR
jgi:sulfatase modifying factor 1